MTVSEYETAKKIREEMSLINEAIDEVRSLDIINAIMLVGTKDMGQHFTANINDDVGNSVIMKIRQSILDVLKDKITDLSEEFKNL